MKCRVLVSTSAVLPDPNFNSGLTLGWPLISVKTTLFDVDHAVFDVEKTVFDNGNGVLDGEKRRFRYRKRRFRRRKRRFRIRKRCFENVVLITFISSIIVIRYPGAG